MQFCNSLIFDFAYYFGTVDIPVEEKDYYCGDEGEDDCVATKKIGGFPKEISDGDECE